MKNLWVGILIFVLSIGFSSRVQGQEGKKKEAMNCSRYQDLIEVDRQRENIFVVLKYSTTDNFMGQDLYGDLDRCCLNRDAAQMLFDAADLLQKRFPELSLLVYDCVRPVEVQRKMWGKVRGTPQQQYVANPENKVGSMHNYACAIDLTLADKQGEPLDLGTTFDFLGRKAQPRHEFEFVKEGVLTQEQWANRLLLRFVMVQNGFLPIANEWWHFNCTSPGRAAKKYKKIY